MKILISRDGEHIANAEVASLGNIPEVAFALSQHHGAGDYTVRAGEDVPSICVEKDKLLFILTTDWKE